jgi:hypothetical protein
MEAKLEAILREIYALEPSLGERDTEVRAMVRALLEARPKVAPDQAFVARLRDEVLGIAPVAAVPTKIPVERHDLLWWSYHLAPLGVFAVLTLALIGGPNAIYRDFMRDPALPPSMHYTAVEPRSAEGTSIAEQAPAPDMDAAQETALPYNASDDTMMMKADPGARSMDMGGDAPALSDDSAAMMATDAETEATAGDRIEIGDQRPGSVVRIDTLSMSSAGHVRLFSYDGTAPRETLATTPLIAPGTQHGMVVTLERPVRPGEAVYAQVFLSDGDAVYEPYEDLPLYGADGGFVYTIFMILQ